MQTTTYSLVVTTLTACLFLSGCDKTDQSYFPLQEGMQWSYNVTKTIRGETEKQKYFFTNLADGKLDNEPVSIRKSIDGTTHYYRETEDGVLLIGTQRQLGLFVRDEHYVFRYPVEKDVQWQEITTTRLLNRLAPSIYKGTKKIRIDFTTEIPVTTKIATTDDTIKIPAGIYSDCIKIVKQGSKLVNLKDYRGYLVGNTVVKVHEISWYAQGVGLVKFIREETTNSHALKQGDIVVELESFDT